jgi:hypothetical protein
MSKFIEVDRPLQKSLINIDHILRVESDDKGEKPTIIMSDGESLRIDPEQAKKIRSHIVAELMI